MNLSVVGGAGRVGSTTLFQLVLEGGFQELAVCDIARDAADGEALDLRHGLALSHRVTVTSGGIEASEGSDFIVITAGIPRQPGETRLDLLKKNVDLIAELRELVAKFSRLTFVKVAGHAGIPLNERTDELAVQAIEQAR